MLLEDSFGVKSISKLAWGLEAYIKNVYEFNLFYFLEKQFILISRFMLFSTLKTKKILKSAPSHTG